jgi:TPR repeat protein
MPKPSTTDAQEHLATKDRRAAFMWPLAGALVAFLNSSTITTAGDFQEGVAAYNQLDSASAWRLLQPLAERGDARAQALVGSMYARGLGATYDGAEAVRWWRKAAEQGDAGAQEELATAYFWGDGVKADHSELLNGFARQRSREKFLHRPLLRICTCAATAFRRTLLWRTCG